MEKKSDRIVIPETKPEDRGSIQEGIEPLTKREKLGNLIIMGLIGTAALIAITLRICGQI